ncbi:MAG: hypothetical protein B7Z15_18355 [Rhizobiales bacterium 32-66-8]|nr:MAG: hypothetical protein B7Z15_18355 [Rhizobiales bacterium 32-66-8]
MTPAAGAARTGMDPLMLRGLAQWISDLERGAFDGGALPDIGLKNGTLIIENESSGRSVAFQHISIRLSRPDHGGAVLTFTSQGPSSTATLVATLGPLRDRQRTLDFELNDVATQDLVQAFTQDWRRFYVDMPLTASALARISQEGQVLAAEASVKLGAGQIGNGEDPQERFTLDSMQLGLKLDPAARSIAISPLSAVKNANIVSLEGQIAVPRLAEQDWTYELHQQQVILAGPEMPDPPLVMDQVKVTGRFTPPNKQLLFETGSLVSTGGSLTFSGMADFGVEVPILRLKAVGSQMPSTMVRRFWPVSIAPPARQYVLENVTDGTIDGTTVDVNMPLDLIGQKEVPLPEDAVHLEMSGSGFTIEALDGLPPIRDGKLSIVVTGRSVRANLPSGTVVTPQGRKLQTSDGVFFLPDYFPREPKAQVSVKFAGPADAGIELLGMEALKGPTGTAYDPSTTRGRTNPAPPG